MGDPVPGPKQALPRWLTLLPIIYLILGLAWVLGSDRLIGWFYPGDLRAFAYASTLKGVLFVILTATLLYALLAIRRVDLAPGSRAARPFGFRKPLLAFCLVGLGIASVSYVVYLLEAEGIRDRARQELTVSAARAAAEFSFWLRSRERAVWQATGGPLAISAVVDGQAMPAEPAEQVIREQLETIRTSQEFDGVAAVAPDGTIRISVGAPIEANDELRALVGEAIVQRRVVSAWSTRVDAGGTADPVAYFAMALSGRAAGPEPAVAAIVARSDLHDSFIPVNAALHARTVSIALARRDGDHVGYMQSSPGAAAGPYTRVSASRTDLPVVRAVSGESGTFFASESRTGEVLVSGFPVAGTPWVAVASVDPAGVRDQIRRLMALVLGMSAFGFVAAAALLVPWWRSLRTTANARVLAAEARAEEMAARLGWVTRHANDVIFLIGPDGAILDANDRAEQTYGYSRDELLALKIFQLRPPEPQELALARSQFATVTQGEALIFQATHVRKDGSRFPVEVSSRQVTLGASRYVQSIVRDISERQRAERQLRESERQYRLLFQSNPQPMWVYDVESLAFLAVNDAAVESYGYSESEFLAMTIADIRPAEDRERLGTDVAEHADDVLQRAGLWRHRLQDGTLIDVEITSHRIEFGGRRARLVHASDVTQRLRAERALRASEERYRSLFENSSDGIVVLESGRRIASVNPEYQAMTGYPRDELLGLDIAAVLGECEHPRLEAAVAGWRGREPVGPATWVHRRKDGSSFTADVRIRALPGGEQLATVRDLTEITSARRKLERQRDLYDLLSQCNQAILKVRDRQELLGAVARLAVERGHFRFAWIGEVDEAGDIVPTARYGDDKGYIGTLRFNVDPASRGGSGPASRAMREGRSVVANDFLNDPKTACWHEAARRSGVAASGAFPIFSGGNVSAALMLYAGEAGFFDREICATLDEMVADVSFALDTLRTRRELDDNRLLLQSLIDASDALIFAFDLEGRAILINDALARVVGRSRAAVIGERRGSFLPRETAEAHEANDRRVVETGRPLLTEERNPEEGGERVYLSTKYPLRDVEGRIYAVGGIATDITELRRMQQQLADANRELETKVAERTREALEALARAEAADRAKTMFLSSMSHELRSPLHSIIGFTSVLLEGLEGELSPVQQEHLQVISDASHHLLAIINDLLDMSRIEAGAIALETKPVAIGQVLERVMQRFSLQAQQKGLVLRLERGEQETWIRSDERRIEQIVGNLVSNAVKYTASGSIAIRYGVQQGRLRIDVIDTGAGIAEADRPRLFKRFSQLKAADGDLVEGTGLGLAIAAGLAEAMGGEVVLDSTPGVGSVFSLLLPIQPGDADP